jgi:hypothetical protein
LSVIAHSSTIQRSEVGYRRLKHDFTHYGMLS